MAGEKPDPAARLQQELGEAALAESDEGTGLGVCRGARRRSGPEPADQRKESQAADRVPHGASPPDRQTAVMLARVGLLPVALPHSVLAVTAWRLEGGPP